jgi:hypothetical protein
LLVVFQTAPASLLGVALARNEAMKTGIQGVIYKGIWPGVGDVYDIKVNAGYTTIIVKSGEDLKKRAKDTQEGFPQRK